MIKFWFKLSFKWSIKSPNPLCTMHS